ncbi:hypothetical protein L6164_031474 [Bauhinia variegata]|uniref:Uncharacterized protein n=1 Tax=Bauhinia variegata TaxID=167791 RepID=A0ACB9LFJ4_BAUVA|nr:hypothetical protein L6164_031474 [Bauhinia variegata]
MPSKLRKALGAVKDQTSISLAKVSNAANLQVTILKATTHDEIPIEERYLNEILEAVSSNKVYAAVCANSIGKRIGKTRNWVVAIKSLMLILRIFQDGDPHFPREIFHQMKKGAKILNLSGFKDDSSSCPWDYTVFVRTFALYLDERLDCFLTGKLQRRFTYFNQTRGRHHGEKRSVEPGIKDMKPTMLLDKISYWQRLLDRAICTNPTGPARTNRLVRISLYSILQESFVLYKDISDGLAVLLDSFFQLPYQASVKAFQACVKSSKQFDELNSFYSLCTCLGIGRTSEYPSVQKVSEELMETLREFLKDQAPLPANNNGYHSSLSKQLSLPNQRDSSSSYGTPERFFDARSKIGSKCTSLEDLMYATDAGISPSRSIESHDDGYDTANDSESSQSFQKSRSSLEMVSLDSSPQVEKQKKMEEKKQKNATLDSKNGSRDGWEIVLANTVTKPEQNSNESDPFVVPTLFDQYNPFLEDVATANVAPSTPTFSTAGNQADFTDLFDSAPTFQAVAPEFSAQKSIEPTMAPTFDVQSSGFDPNLALNISDLNPNGMAMVPTFNAETEKAPTFHVQNPNRLTAAHSTPTFPVHYFNEMSMAPTFNAEAPEDNGWSQTFHGHNANMMSTAPTFSIQNLNMTMAEPAFRTRHLHRTMTEPTFDAQNRDKILVPPAFHAQNFGGGIAAAPTFSVKDSNYTTSIEEDPFGPWPSAMANQHASGSVLLQQKMWLEQQNKIIAKRMA